MHAFRSSRTLTCRSAALPEHLGQPALVPVRLTGEEGLNRLFEYRLELKTPEALAFSPSQAANFDLSEMVGKEITVAIELEGQGHFIPGAVGGGGAANLGAGVREISALVTEAEYLRAEGRHHVYGLTLRPWLWLATQTADCKLFQDKSVIGVLDAVLADYPFAVEKRLSEQYPPRDLQVQYNESDYAFLARLCEEWGLAWWFEHSDGKHRLILADSPGAWRASPSEAYREIAYYPPGHRTDEESLHAFRITDRLVTGAWASGDVDYTRTRADLSVRYADPRSTGHAEAEIFRWPIDSSQPKAGAGGMSGEPNDPLTEGQHLARVRLQALRAQGWRATAQGHVRGLAAGHTFRLQKHPQDKANIEWFILSATLDIEEIGEESQGTAGLPAQQWRCTVDFTAQPAREAYAPPLTVPRPEIKGGLRAKVTAPAGKEIWTDSLGRVKVAFPWDRYHENDERSSCWLRAVSPWAGNQYGGIQLPRAGQEVWVEFEGGDPDRPLITGRVVNNQNLPPWALPANQALSGFRSKELYGQQANHLILDDTEGAIQAQLSSDHALSQLNLGSITRVPDPSGRADQRGEGFELRTDAHGVVRAADGLLLTTERRDKAASHVKSMGEALSRLDFAHDIQAKLADLAIQCEAQTAGQQDKVVKAIEEQNESLQGKGIADGKNGQFPEFDKPHLALSSPSGIEASTDASIHLASREHAAITTGGNLGIAVEGGLYACMEVGGVRIFTDKNGQKYVALHDNIEFDALSNSIIHRAKVNIVLEADQLLLNAKTKTVISGAGEYISLSNAGIEFGSVTGITAHAPKFERVGPKNMVPPELAMPDGVCLECMKKAALRSLAVLGR